MSFRFLLAKAVLHFTPLAFWRGVGGEAFILHFSFFILHFPFPIRFCTDRCHFVHHQS